MQLASVADDFAVNLERCAAARVPRQVLGSLNIQLNAAHASDELGGLHSIRPLVRAALAPWAF